MYLLASDYDGTFKKNNHGLYINIETINKFRKEGNKFAIVIGRSFSSIKREICKYRIDYDYISCNNGLIVFDNNDKILTKNCLSNDITKIIINKLKENESTLCFDFYNEYGMIFKPENLLEIFTEFRTKYDALKFKKYIENSLDDVNCCNFENKLFIGSNQTKADAVKYIQFLENICKDKVYTVGDDINDLQMLKEFNGYKMLNCNPKMWFNNIPVAKEVYTLIKKLINKRCLYE